MVSLNLLISTKKFLQTKNCITVQQMNKDTMLNNFFLFHHFQNNLSSLSVSSSEHSQIKIFHFVDTKVFLTLGFSYPGYDIFEKAPMKDSMSASESGTPPLRLGCFYMLVFVPITCAMLQLATWSRFTLHGRKLQGIKTLRQGTQHGSLIDVKAI